MEQVFNFLVNRVNRLDDEVEVDIQIVKDTVYVVIEDVDGPVWQDFL